MRFLPVVSICAVLAVALPRTADAADVAALVALAEAETMAEPVLHENLEMKKQKPRSTTTLSPKDLFLMHATHATKKEPARKKGATTPTKAPTTQPAPATPASTVATEAPVKTAATAATEAVSTSTAKPKGKGKGKGRGKPKPKPKAKSRSSANGNSTAKSSAKAKAGDKNCKTKGNRKSRAECQHTAGDNKDNKESSEQTVVTHLNTTAGETAGPAGPAAATAAAAAASSAASASGSDTAIPVDQAAPESGNSKPNAVADTDMLTEAPVAEHNVGALQMDGNAPQPEVETKADLIARDTVNGTHDDRNVSP
ncbi:hypothetical protein KR222_007189 [Zaprionus bogoriensis]|nr:hypothetical protein KR222_007189 [Zaprionus bogoriensis]